LELVVVGGPSESEILTTVENMIEQNKNIRFVTTTLEELVVLVRDCVKFVGLDSGPMNLAVCLNKPVVSLFGPGDSEMWHPLNHGSKMIHRKEKFPCNPCLQTVCYFPLSNCMDQVEVKEVVNLINS
jgi:ADP-heptose:LPS heptosyltransferase